MAAFASPLPLRLQLLESHKSGHGHCGLAGALGTQGTVTHLVGRRGKGEPGTSTRE